MGFQIHKETLVAGDCLHINHDLVQIPQVLVGECIER